MNVGRHRHRPGSILPRASVSVDKFLRAGVVAGVVLALAACGPRPVGDFGRARPSFTHDTAMPAVGGALARARREPVSSFNQTDQEREMHDRVWRFLVSPHTQDWFYDVAVELQRTRVTPALDHKYAPDRYYNWLRSADYRSSRTRYATVGRDIAADLDTIPATFLAICAVIEVDRQRAVAQQGLQLGGEATADVAARRAENDMRIAWFVRALNYRYTSYNYALDHLLVETPHEQSMAVDEALRQLHLFVGRANRHDFCSGARGGLTAGHAVVPSRYATQRIDTEIVLPK